SPGTVARRLQPGRIAGGKSREQDQHHRPPAHQTKRAPASPKPAKLTVARSPGFGHCVATTLPVCTIMPRRRGRPRAATVLATQASACSGWPFITSPPRPRPISTPLIAIAPLISARSSRRQSVTAAPRTQPAFQALLAMRPRPPTTLILVTAVILDEFDRRHAGFDRLGDALRAVRLGAGRQVAAQPHRNLTLDRDAGIVAVAQRRGRRMDGPGENSAGDRMVDAHELLHHWRGECDLVAGDRPALSGQQRLQRLLHRIGLLDAGAADFRWR